MVPAALLLAVCSVSACCGIHWSAEDGTYHHLILGVGIVSHKQGRGDTELTAVRTTALGLHVTDAGPAAASAGLTARTVVLVPDGARNTCAEVASTPLRSLLIRTCESTARFAADSTSVNNEQGD